MTGTIIGCDPGKEGALIALSPAGALLLAIPLPLYLDQPDPRAARDAVANLPKPWHVFIEAPISVRHGKSVTDSGYLALKKSVAFWKSVLGVKSPTMVHPKTWQGAMLMGVQGATTKDRSVRWSRTFMPGLDLFPGKRTTPSDGLSDAACIAEYGRRALRLTA